MTFFLQYIDHLIHILLADLWCLRLDHNADQRLCSALAEEKSSVISECLINDKPDGLNINRGCGSTHIGELQKFVKEKGLDVGFAYDGDADRCLAVDENGNVVDGDLILYICLNYMF